MCGIAGFVDAGAVREPEALRSRAAVMAAPLAHRGPDDHGIWVDPDHGVALAHTRLSILDLSTTGHQPMTSPSDRYVVSYNGELYNFRELKAELACEGVRFRSTTDTEVFLAGFDVWGVTKTLERANGMFAFALWDRADLSITLARDRLGEKPLYYGRAGHALIFSSELTGVRAYPGPSRDVDRDALATFLRYGYVPAPMSILEGIFKLPPAHLVTIPQRTLGLPAPSRYWRPSELTAQRNDATTSREAAADLHDRLRRAVRMRLEADVPVGAFLSGGVDSSTIVALAQEASTAPFRTFSVGFDDPSLDESGFSSAVADHLGTEHTEIRVTFAEALETAPRLGGLFDEPFADPSQIPTVLLAAVARRHVKVALSGDGGDELFGGYGRYTWEDRIWRTATAFPTILRRSGYRALTAIPPSVVSRLALGRRAGDTPPFADRVLRAAALLSTPHRFELYERMMSRWSAPPVTDGRTGINQAFFDTEIRRHSDDALTQLTRVDLVTYLPDDILVKVDRASMNVGLEARVPLLDPDIVAFALRLPTELKVSGGRTKIPLRDVLSHYLPAELIERPKQAFTVPLASWLRGALRDWAEDLLEPSRLERDGYLDVATVRRHWQEHVSGRRDWHLQMWTVLMFQAWLRATEIR